MAKIDDNFLENRNKKIRTMLGEGKTIQQIMLAVNVTKTTIATMHIEVKKALPVVELLPKSEKLIFDWANFKNKNAIL